MPNSYVNDNGKPNLNNSNVENDNDARVLVRIEVVLGDTLTPAAYLTAGFGEFSLQFEGISVIYQVKFQKRSQFQRGQFSIGIGSDEVDSFMAFRCMFGEDQLLQRFATAGDRRLPKRIAILFIYRRDEHRQFFVYFVGDRNNR